jgi:hypothetical protein
MQVESKIYKKKNFVPRNKKLIEDTPKRMEIGKKGLELH